MSGDSPNICEQCESQAEVLREGRTQGIRCARCGWSVVTTYMPLIQLDRTTYEVRIERGDSQNLRQIKSVAHVMGSNFLSAKELLENAPSLVFSGDAQHVMQVRDSLVAAGLAVAIQPEFPW